MKTITALALALASLGLLAGCPDNSAKPGSTTSTASAAPAAPAAASAAASAKGGSGW